MNDDMNNNDNDMNDNDVNHYHMNDNDNDMNDNEMNIYSTDLNFNNDIHDNVHNEDYRDDGIDDDDDDEDDDYKSENDEDALREKIDDLRRIPSLRPMCRVLRLRLHKLLKQNGRMKNSSNSNNEMSIDANTNDNADDDNQTAMILDASDISQNNNYDNDKMELTGTTINSNENNLEVVDIQVESDAVAVSGGGQFVVGEIVDVVPRMWPGMNKQGGVARILKVHEDEDNGYTYDVRYTVVGGSEKEVLESYIKSRNLENANIRSTVKGRCKVQHCPCFIKDCGHIQPGEPGYEEDQFERNKKNYKKTKDSSDVIATMKDKQQRQQERKKVNGIEVSRDVLQNITGGDREKKTDLEHRKTVPKKLSKSSNEEDMIQRNKKKKSQDRNIAERRVIDRSYLNHNNRVTSSKTKSTLESQSVDNNHKIANEILNQVIAECSDIEANVQDRFIQPEKSSNGQLLPQDLRTKAMQMINTINGDVALALLELGNEYLSDGIQKIKKIKADANNLRENLSTIISASDNSTDNNVKVAWDVLNVVDAAHDVSTIIERAAMDTFDKTFRRLGALKKQNTLDNQQIRCRRILDQTQSNLRELWRQEKMSINAAINSILNRFESIVGYSPEHIVNEAGYEDESMESSDEDDDSEIEYLESTKGVSQYKNKSKSRNLNMENIDDSTFDDVRVNQSNRSNQSYQSNPQTRRAPSIFGPDRMIGVENRQGISLEERQKKSTKISLSNNVYDDVSDFIIDDVNTKPRKKKDPTTGTKPRHQRRLWIDEDVLMVKEEVTADVVSSFLSSISSNSDRLHFSRSYSHLCRHFNIQEAFVALWTDVRTRHARVTDLRNITVAVMEEYFKIATCKMDKGGSNCYQDVLSLLWGPLTPSDDHIDSCFLDHVQLQNCRAFSVTILLSYLKTFELKYILCETSETLSSFLGSLYYNHNNGNLMEGIRAIEWYRRKVRFLRLSMNFHAEKAKLRQSSKELTDNVSEEEPLDDHMKAISICWHELENIFQQLIGSIIVVKGNIKKEERRPGLTTIILIALKKLQHSSSMERTDESNIVTVAYDFVALWIDLIDAFTQINPWQSRQQCFSSMNTLNFSKKPWKIVNKVIQLANDNHRQIIDNEIIAKIVEVDKFVNISIDSVLAVLALHSWSLLRLLPVESVKRIPNNWNLMRYINGIYLDEKTKKVDPISGETLKSRVSISSYIDIYPSLGLLWDLPHEGFYLLLGLSSELAHFEASLSSSLTSVKKSNDGIEKVVYQEVFDILHGKRIYDSLTSMKKIISQLFISSGLIDPFTSIKPAESRKPKYKSIADVVHIMRLYIRASISDRPRLEALNIDTNTDALKARVESMDGKRFKSIFRQPDSGIFRLITTTNSHSPTFHHWLLASLITAELVVLYGVDMFEAADDKNPTVKENKLLQILGSSDLVTSDDKLFCPYWGITVDEQACIMWLLSTTVFNPERSVYAVPSKNNYVEKCILSELLRFSAAYNIETSRDHPFLINKDQMIEKTSELDRRLLLTSLGVVVTWSTSHSLEFDSKVLSLQLTLALSYLTVEKNTANLLQKGPININNVIKQSREGLCILGYSIACKEFKRVVASLVEGQATTLNTNIITSAFPLILDLLKKSLNTLKCSRLDWDKNFDFGHSKCADLESQFTSIAPFFLTNAISDITLSLININGQSCGQPNHLYAHSLLVNTDKVLVEQDVVRPKPHIVTTKANAKPAVEQRPFLVGSWLTCILWEPILRAAAASINIFIGEINEYISADARGRCKSIISLSTIHRLFLESWPASMISFLYMTNLGKIVKVFELFELSSCIHLMLPACQEFVQFSIFLSSQSATLQHNRMGRYAEFNNNIKYNLTKYFQLISLSKDSVSTLTKLMAKVIGHFVICAFHAKDKFFYLQRTHLIRSLLVLTIVSSEPNSEVVSKAIKDTIFREFISLAVKDSIVTFKKQQQLRKASRNMIGKRSYSELDDVRISAASEQDTSLVVTYLLYYTRCIAFIGYLSAAKDWDVLLHLLVTAWTTRDGIRQDPENASLVIKVLSSWCLSLTVLYSTDDIAWNEEMTSSSSSSCIDRGIHSSIGSILEIAKPLFLTINNADHISHANGRLSGFRNYLLHFNKPWEVTTSNSSDTATTTTSNSSDTAATKTAATASSLLATRMAMTIHVPFIYNKFQISSSSSSPIPPSSSFFSIQDWMLLMSSVIVLIIKVIRALEGVEPKTIDDWIGPNSNLSDANVYIDDALLQILRAMKSGIFQVDENSNKENNESFETSIATFRELLGSLSVIIQRCNTNTSTNSIIDDNDIFNFSILVTKFIDYYMIFLACTKSKENPCNNSKCPLCKGGEIVSELRSQLHKLSSSTPPSSSLKTLIRIDTELIKLFNSSLT